MKVAGGQQFLSQGHRSVVGIGKEGVFDDDSTSATGLQHAYEVLQEEVGRLTVWRKFCWTSLRSLPPKGGLANTTLWRSFS